MRRPRRAEGAGELLGPVHPDPEAFLECLEPLQPRLYSISSSPLATPDELHLTVDAVRYDLEGRRRLGVASTYLADRLGHGDGAGLRAKGAWICAASRSRPRRSSCSDPAPASRRSARSSHGRRRNQGANVGKLAVFRPSARNDDFFYRDELLGMQQTGALTRLTTAWSRDKGRKTYVQDRMRETGVELWAG